MDETARYGLPQLAPGQAQNEWAHNEALLRIDLLLCAALEGAASATPPASPLAGACYLIGAGATGAWAGKDGRVAGFTEGGWRFIAPIDGMRLLDRTSGQLIVRRGGTWESGISRAAEYKVAGVTVVREQQAAIADPTGGTIVDGQSRAAVSAILGAADPWLDCVIDRASIL